MGILRGRRLRPSSVALVTREGCTLCAAAEPVVRRAAVDAGLVLQVLDVDADPELRAAYTDKVPVVLLDGVEHAYWQVDEKTLRRALRG
ncbi:MAG: putative redoxin [Frankiales bacterium]|nr:putative redoxin [Frankiales bacterium]